ncbi:MAG TPA: helix-hairpin-helix domain-containing protein [Candidatus Aquilonibacter sp.]
MLRLAVVLVIVVIAAVAIWHPASGTAIAVATAQPRPAATRSAHAHLAAPADARIIVYVVGAVQRPGLYALAPSARIDAAVRLAGGMRADADPAGVNLAARAGDGDEIIVPARGQTAPGAVRAKLARGPTARRVRKAVAAVDLNRANAVDLTAVPGIGATIAARIVAVRERDGLFTTYDQLLDIAGMTQARLDRAQPYLRL